MGARGGGEGGGGWRTGRGTRTQRVLLLMLLVLLGLAAFATQTATLKLVPAIAARFTCCPPPSQRKAVRCFFFGIHAHKLWGGGALVVSMWHV